MSNSKFTIIFSSVAAGLLTAILLVSLHNGITQQYFEHIASISEYFENLRRHADALYVIIGLDNFFILIYFLSTYFLRLTLLRRSEANTLLTVFVFLVGAIALLDYAENFHILAMLSSSDHAVSVSTGQIELQFVLSAMKWHLSHVAFFLLGLSIVPRNGLEKFFVFSLIFWQMPVGIIVYTAGTPEAQDIFIVLRYANLLFGFILIAIVTAMREKSVETLRHS